MAEVKNTPDNPQKGNIKENLESFNDTLKIINIISRRSQVIDTKSINNVVEFIGELISRIKRLGDIDMSGAIENIKVLNDFITPIANLDGEKINLATSSITKFIQELSSFGLMDTGKVFINISKLIPVFELLNKVVDNMPDLDKLKSISNLKGAIDTIKSIENFDKKTAKQIVIFGFLFKKLVKSIDGIPDVDPKKFNIDLSPILNTAKTFSETDIGAGSIIKIKLIRYIISELRDIVYSLNTMEDTHVDLSAASNIVKISNEISNINISPLIKLKLKLLKMAIGEISFIIQTVNDKKWTVNVNEGKIDLIKGVILSFIGVITLIMVSLPLLMLFVMMSPLIIAMFWIVGKMVGIIFKLLGSISIKAALKGIFVLVLINLLLFTVIMIALTMLLLAVIGDQVVSNVLNILATIGIMVLFIVIVGLLLFAATLILPYILLFIPVIAILVTMVMGIMLIAGALWLLQWIELDMFALEDVVNGVIDVSLLILDKLKDADVIDAFEIMLIFTSLSVGVFGMLLIAGMLWLLQWIDFDKDEILTKVSDIIEICISILDKLFESNKHSEKSTGILQGITDYVGGAGLTRLFESIISAATLLVMVVAVFAILLIAGMLFLLSYIDRDRIVSSKDVALAVIDAAMFISNILVGNEVEITRSTPDGEVKKLYRGEFGGIIDLLLSVIKLATLVFAIGIIIAIGYMLNWVASMDVKSKEAKDKVVEVMSNLDDIVDAIINPPKKEIKEENSESSILDYLIEATGMKYLQLLLKMASLGIIIGALTLIKHIAENINNILNVDVSNFGVVATRVNDIMNTATSVVNKILSNNTLNEIDDDDVDDINIILNSINSNIKELNNIAESLKKLQDYGLNKEIIDSHVSIIISASSQKFDMEREDIKTLNMVKKFSNILEDIGGNLMDFQSNELNKSIIENNMSVLKSLKVPDINVSGAQSLLEISDKLAKATKNSSHISLEGLTKVFNDVGKADSKNIESITSNYIKFLDKVNSTDVEKLKTTSNMMKHWAELSRSLNGNFDGLARALNEHILPALDELNDTMENVKTTLESANTQRAEMYADKGGANADPAKIAAQPTSNVGENETSKRVREAQKRLKDARINTNSVADILLSGEAVVKVKH